MSEGEASTDVGFGKPPRSTRFAAGKSGNPRGRPRGRKRELPYDGVLGQMVTIKEDGCERRVTAAEAFLLHLTKRGLEGDSAAARASLAAIEQAKASRGPEEHVDTIVLTCVEPGSVSGAVVHLAMGVKVRPYSERPLLMLNAWVVQVALDRLGDRQLSPQDQRTVWEATRERNKVRWPVWWVTSDEGDR